MKYKNVLVAVGNYGAKYEKTRHNIGFMCLDYAAARGARTSWKLRPSCGCDYTDMSRLDGSETDLLLKPQSFMNILGTNVQRALQTFSVNQKQLIVLHDDLEMKIGNYKIVQGTSFKGHNGLKSISERLGGFSKFTRIAIGIGRPPERDAEFVSHYVL